MKTIAGIALWTGIFFAYATQALAQRTVEFKTGVFTLEAVDVQVRRSQTESYLFYDPGHPLTESEIVILKRRGVDLLYALKNNIYWVRINSNADPLPTTAFFDIDPAYKLSQLPDSRNNAHRLRLAVAPGLSSDTVSMWASRNNIRVIDIRALAFGIMDVEIETSSLDELIKTAWISFIESIPVDEEINYRLLHAERGWSLRSSLFEGLTGEGITLGIGDGGRLGSHHDWSRGVLDLAGYTTSAHAMQVTGIVTGSGLIEPVYGYGYAPEANVLIRNFSDILWDAPQYVSDFNLTLTNNSYGSSLEDCRFIGDYDASSLALDAMMMSIPKLLHVFAAGNSGGLTCSPYPFRYSTIAGGYQCSKNVLTVGAIRIDDWITNFSSQGPVDDGRLKPEVVAYGLGRISTIDNNLYASNSGTSFSSPATMGMAALLYEKYKEIHHDSLPDAALIKNIICNTADDLGNTGPDYTFGFGRINGDRAVKMIEAAAFDSVNVTHNIVYQRTLIVPANTGSFDVMSMWNDYPSAPYETVALVNDVDMSIITPAGDTLLPWKLNYTPAGVTMGAFTGKDHLNNYEQITVNNPVQGVYTILIKGYDIPMGPQPVWITWDLQATGLKVQSPCGGEIFRPGDTHYIRWDAFGLGSSTFNVEYSIDEGVNWLPVATNIGAGVRHQIWTVPSTHTDKLKVRVTSSGGTSDVSDFNAVIMRAPANLTVTSPCNGYVNATWNAVTNAAYYRIYKIENETLTLLDTTSSLSIVLGGINPAVATWFAVCGVFPSGENGLRSRAVLITPNGGNNCQWDHDLRLDSLINPVSGRALTSTGLTSAEPIKVYLANTGTMDAQGFSISYKINNAPVVSENFSGTINAGAGQYFTFAQTADLSFTGNYEILVWTSYPLDLHRENDTIAIAVKHLANNAIVLPLTEGFENASDDIIEQTTLGFPGLDNVDATLNMQGRIRTFAGSSFAHNGNRALTLDARKNVSSNGEVLITLNFQNYNAGIDDIRMSLYHMHHEISPDNNTEKIFIRGSDQDTFVLLHDFEITAASRGQWMFITGLEISEALLNANQNYSSSFQIKFPFTATATAGDPSMVDGKTIDDISFHRIDRDLRLVEIIHPQAVSCGLGQETITVSVANTTFKPIPNATVSYQINNGATQITNVGTIPADTTLVFSLIPTADFSIPGNYDIVIWVDSPADLYKWNDTIRTAIIHSPLINDYPYLETFDVGNANWYTGGINSSWQFGKPSKNNISHAAEGDDVWTTKLSGTHNADEESYLYSPCFDLTGLTQPYLSFAVLYQLEVNYDYAWVEYRLDGSNEWNKLLAGANSTNWYNHVTNTWNGNQLKWISCGTTIPFTDTTIQFRIVMKSDVGLEYEGIAIDQIHVFDRLGIYNTPVQISRIVSGNQWVDFDLDGQRLFSIHPQGQNLGTVTLSLYKSNQNFVIADSFYLLSRNWHLTSQNQITTAAKLRVYYTTVEANNLLAANGCAHCNPAMDAFNVAVVRYAGANEDGIFSNNVAAGVTSYSTDSTFIFPYENGYVAEWKTSSLSEWWISTPVTKTQGTVVRKITSWSDDAEEHQDNGSVNPIREKLALTEYNGKQRLGLRFKNITIPAGSYITSAHLRFTSSSAQTQPAQWTIQSQLAADAATFSTAKYNISGRLRSNQIVKWLPSAWSNNTTFTSPNIQHLIQQVIDTTGWKNGNDLVLILSGTGFREAWSLDGDSSKSAELVISFDSECDDNAIIYVDQNAMTGEQNGSTWSNAYRSLEQALDRADHCPSITQIWIADGIYSPYLEVTRDKSFNLREGLSIYGGFSGGETSITQRIYGANPTILSGDIGSLTIPGDNLYHVVTILPGVDPVLLDGITIRDGMSNGPTPLDQTGSAIYNQGILHAHQVIIFNSSAPSVYNTPGAELRNLGIIEIRP